MVKGEVGGAGRECSRLRSIMCKGAAVAGVCKVKITRRGYCGWRKEVALYHGGPAWRCHSHLTLQSSEDRVMDTGFYLQRNERQYSTILNRRVDM